MGIFPRISTGDKTCVFTQFSEQNSTKNKGTQESTMKVAYAVCLLVLVGLCFCEDNQDAVTDYTAWTTNPTYGIAACYQSANPKTSCMAAAAGEYSSDGTNPVTLTHSTPAETTWADMCNALVDYHCEDDALGTAITESNKCCTGTPAAHGTACQAASATDNKGRNKCCSDCIKANAPPAPPPPPHPLPALLPRQPLNRETKTPPQWSQPSPPQKGDSPTLTLPSTSRPVDSW